MLFSLLSLLCTAAQADDSFSVVEKIFQGRCLSCHNEDQRKGDFSIQTAESVFDADVIEVGDADSSHLVDLIVPTDGQAEMPKDARPLSPKEIAAIKKWIDGGAKWPDDKEISEPIVQDFDWWSYRPITKPAIPENQDSWIRNPIDAFVLRKQIENGLSHAAEADRRTLIRRLTFDLWGLPPTPEQVKEFVEDTNPNAYEQLVDRLLDSEHYGERWARHWLDVVKYADTCGYDKDKLRNNAWPYRDYVIRSFNADKPYSRFIEEQIAGDVIYPGTEDGILGLGFIAAGPWDFIGHVEVSESKIDGKVARNLDRDEMVSNTINTFCSLTVQCARCHHHKFDPISQQDYYGLQAIFAAVDRAERRYDTDPHIETKRQKLETEIAELTNQSKTLEQEIEKEGGEELKKLNKTIAEVKPKLKVKKSPEFGYHSQIASDPITEKWVQVELPKKSRLAKIVLRPCHDDYANIGAGFGFPIRFKVDVSESQNGADDWSNVRDETKTDFINPGLAPVTIPCNQEVRRIRITATRLAIRSGDYIFALAELQAIDAEGNDVAVGAKVTSLDSIEAPVRWRRSNLTDGKFAVTADLAAQKQFADAHQQRDRLLASIETDERIDKRNQLSAALKKARQELNALPTGKMVYAAATHFKPQGNFQPTKGKPREVRVLHRGEVTKPKEIAQPGVLAFAAHQNPRLPGENEAEKRKALALWLTDKSHPLVWRSIVNRVWQYHFGIGIVATPNDFGRMGATPTHPELLNWLATWFRDGDQSLKQLHRLIVTSSTYRQASNFHRNNAETDRGNQFLWRMNRRRLEAEEIRDSILSVSGALDIKMYGPGFHLFELEKTAHSPHYEYHKFDPSDASTHRRSIYRFIVRSQPDPWMTVFDCADSSQSTPRRNETLTALQALSLLNNRFNLVMSERFAKRIKSEFDQTTDQVNVAVRYAFQREPSESERRAMVAYAGQHGMNNLCRFLFNLNEFVYID